MLRGKLRPRACDHLVGGGAGASLWEPNKRGGKAAAGRGAAFLPAAAQRPAAAAGGAPRGLVGGRPRRELGEAERPQLAGLSGGPEGVPLGP